MARFIAIVTLCALQAIVSIAFATSNSGVAVLAEYADEHLEREVAALARETAEAQGSEMPRQLRTMSTSIVVYELRVRALFVKANARDPWQPVCAPADESQTVANCDQSVIPSFAKLYRQSEWIAKSLFSRNDLTQIPTDGLLPTESCCGADTGFLKTDLSYKQIGAPPARDSKYSGQHHIAVAEPQILTTSSTKLNDPEHWARLERPVRAILDSKRQEQIRSAVQSVGLCHAPPEKYSHERKPVRFKWQSKFTRATESYRNKSNDQLHRVQLTDHFWRTCRESGGQRNLSPAMVFEAWYSQPATGIGTIHILPKTNGSFGFARLEPLRFGDFDGDGKSEALFLYRAYVRDGYVLFSDRMQKHAYFIWGYH
jgi:hypothetical protein